jgi:hypothetical protein
MMKACLICGGAFEVRPGGPKTCSLKCRREQRREYNRVLYEAQREQRLEYMRSYRPSYFAANRERLRKRKREYNAANLARRRECGRRFYAIHRELITERNHAMALSYAALQALDVTLPDYLTTRHQKYLFSYQVMKHFPEALPAIQKEKDQ